MTRALSLSLILSAFFFSLALPLLGDAYFLTLSLQVLINVLVVLGLYILQGLAGQISLGQAGFMAIGGYVGAIYSVKLNYPPLGELPVVIATTLGVAVVFSLPFIKWEGPTLAFGTLAFGYITQLLFKSFEYTGGGEGFGVVVPLSFLGLSLDSLSKLYYFTWVVVGLTFVLVEYLRHSWCGRVWLSIKEEPSIAPLFGFRPSRYILLALTLSSVLAGIAGCLKVHLMSYVGPDMFSVETSIFLVVILVVAGERHPRWACLSAVFFTLLPEALGEFADLHPLLFSLILIFVVLKKHRLLIRMLKSPPFFNRLNRRGA